MSEQVIGSRGSALARWQAEWACGQVRALGCEARIEYIRTTGDRIQDVTLSRFGGKGTFTKELDEALLAGRVTFCVHSLKDVPTPLPEGIVLAAVPARAAAHDVLLGRTAPKLDALPNAARVGTCSLRRRAQIAARRPDIQLLDLRGNVDTRLRKLDAGEFDAIVLARAGLDRLGFSSRVTEDFPVDVMIPAPAQGALGIVCRAEDDATRELLARLDDVATRTAVTAERHLLTRLEGGCEIPLGAHASPASGGQLRLAAILTSLDGKQALRVSADGDASTPTAIADRAFEDLARQGAVELVRRIRAGIKDAAKGSL